MQVENVVIISIWSHGTLLPCFFTKNLACGSRGKLLGHYFSLAFKHTQFTFKSMRTGRLGAE